MSFDSTTTGDIIEHDDVILGYQHYLVMYRPLKMPYGCEILNTKTKLKSHVSGDTPLEVLGKAYNKIMEETE